MDFEKEFIKLLGDDYSNYDECNDYSESQGYFELLSPFSREKYNINVVFIVDEEIRSDDISKRIIKFQDDLFSVLTKGYEKRNKYLNEFKLKMMWFCRNTAFYSINESKEYSISKDVELYSFESKKKLCKRYKKNSFVELLNVALDFFDKSINFQNDIRQKSIIFVFTDRKIEIFNKIKSDYCDQFKDRWYKLSYPWLYLFSFNDFTDDIVFLPGCRIYDITELKNTNFLTDYIERDICGDFI